LRSRVSRYSEAHVRRLSPEQTAGIRTWIASVSKRINEERVEAAERALERAARELERAGWQTRTATGPASRCAS